MRRQKIRDAAFALFVEKGYAESSLQEIAERAEVTIPTIYNYFGSKSSLLLEIAVEKQEGMEEKLDRFIATKIRDDPVRATSGWIKLVTEGALEALDREVWRSIYQTGLGDDNLGPFLDRLQVFYLRKAVEFLQALKARGLIDPEVNVKAQAKILDSICEHYFRRLIFGDGRVRARYVAEVPALVTELFRGMVRKDAD